MAWYQPIHAPSGGANAGLDALSEGIRNYREREHRLSEQLLRKGQYDDQQRRQFGLDYEAAVKEANRIAEEMGGGPEGLAAAQAHMRKYLGGKEPRIAKHIIADTEGGATPEARAAAGSPLAPG